MVLNLFVVILLSAFKDADLVVDEDTDLTWSEAMLDFFHTLTEDPCARVLLFPFRLCCGRRQLEDAGDDEYDFSDHGGEKAGASSLAVAKRNKLDQDLMDDVFVTILDFLDVKTPGVCAWGCVRARVCVCVHLRTSDRS